MIADFYLYIGFIYRFHQFLLSVFYSSVPEFSFNNISTSLPFKFNEGLFNTRIDLLFI